MANNTTAKLAATHPDKLGAGLHIRGKTLSIKTVRCATSPAEVLAVCLSHNLRQSNEEHRHRSRIDPARTGANEVLRGSASLALAEELVRNIFDELGIVPARCDAIMGLEFVFQPPDGADTPAFWDECLAWAAARYQHIVSAVVHRDQARPHMHLLALAVSDGRLMGGEMTNGKNRLTAQSREFMAHMRVALKLRPDRKVKPAKVKTLADLAVSTGRGQKTKAAAAKSDAAMMARAELKRSVEKMGKEVDGQGSPALGIGDFLAHSKTPTSLIAKFSDADDWRQKMTRNGAMAPSLTALCMAA